ncbi:hypothetical protein CEXT_127761 [Caerostris extrusa]|uniref:Uncharacterized protein n=1 Tax=Caerostris extrusa TaxID=172846 RepID=A0AAV4TBP3_CAEEX|nr:hypothetical protein CEXT_127761 [Caerostris extrusa]
MTTDACVMCNKSGIPLHLLHPSITPTKKRFLSLRLLCKPTDPPPLPKRRAPCSYRFSSPCHLGVGA